MVKLEDSLLLALEALKPYLPDIVISGGWVPFVYHSYLGTTRPAHKPLGTKDVDIAVSADLLPGERPSLREILQNEHAEERRGGMPLGHFGPKGAEETIYEFTKDGVEIELTFMTPRHGHSGGRGGDLAAICGRVARFQYEGANQGPDFPRAGD